MGSDWTYVRWCERASRSANAEPVEPLGLLLVHVDPVNVRPRWSRAAELDEGFNRIGVALEDSFDRTVVAVAHPTGDPLGRGLLLGRVAEEDALHVSVHHHPSPHRHGRDLPGQRVRHATTRTVRSWRSEAPRRLPPSSSVCWMYSSVSALRRSPGSTFGIPGGYAASASAATRPAARATGTTSCGAKNASRASITSSPHGGGSAKTRSIRCSPPPSRSTTGPGAPTSRSPVAIARSPMP